MSKTKRDLAKRQRERRSKGTAPYCAIHTADRLGNLSDIPYDNWRWNRLNEVRDIMRRATAIWISGK